MGHKDKVFSMSYDSTIGGCTISGYGASKITVIHHICSNDYTGINDDKNTKPFEYGKVFIFN
jgi:hypothetical protein